MLDRFFRRQPSLLLAPFTPAERITVALAVRDAVPQLRADFGELTRDSVRIKTLTARVVFEHAKETARRLDVIDQLRYAIPARENLLQSVWYDSSASVSVLHEGK